MWSDAPPVAVLALALVLGACGGSRKDAGERAEDPAAAAARKVTAAARADLERAGELAKEGRTEAAWTAWRAARDRLGETPEVAATADGIRRAEKAARHESRYKAALAALNGDKEAKTEEERMAAFEKAIEAGTAFLSDYPDSKHRAEIEAGIGYAKSERKLRADYLEALKRAGAALDGGKPREALAAAREAIGHLDRPPARALEDRALAALAPEDMVYVAAGFFLSGKNREKTFCPGFYIDRHEVTNRRYARFVKATGHAAPEGWAGGKIPEGREEHPVVHVTIEDALAYAKWAKMRLPTELEWERAARGKDGRAYPWGNEWDASKGNFAPGGTLPVGSRPFDRSPDGVMDMGGNVMELTVPVDDPAGATMGPVIKGGHWSDDFHPEYALTFSRWPVDRKHQDVATGFRCARSLP
jgi:formylglycine-generating enzyme required for sulfatase activity